MNEEQNNQNKPHTKVTLGLVLSWVLGVLAAISGITLLFSQFLTGILMLLLASILLPPANKFVVDKLNFSISGGLKFIVVIILLGVIGATMSTNSTPNTNTSPGTEQANINDTNEQAQSQQEEVVTNQDTQKAEEPKEDTTPKEKKPAVASFGNGTHIVGTDIKAGTYRSQGTRTCYWARLSGFSGQLDDVIGNGNNSPEIVMIGASDAAFETSGCGQWVAVKSTYPATPATSFSDGTYEVGKHITAGTYRADGNPDDLCYWARLSGFSQAGTSNVITNGNSPTVIQISSSDKGFTASGCGTWTKI